MIIAINSNRSVFTQKLPLLYIKKYTKSAREREREGAVSTSKSKQSLFFSRVQLLVFLLIAFV